ncbi:MAG: hypothetical protein ACLFTK_13485 [Anaerolineales bacterium]
MQPSFIMRVGVLLGALLMLAACGQGISEDDAEDALRAAFEGDVETANPFFCEGEQITEDEVLAQGAVLHEVECDKRGLAVMRCTLAFESAEDAEITLPAQDLEVEFRIIEDDLLCDARVSSAETESEE